MSVGMGMGRARDWGALDSADYSLPSQGDSAMIVGPPGPRGAKGDMVSRSYSCADRVFLRCERGSYGDESSKVPKR